MTPRAYELEYEYEFEGQHEWENSDREVIGHDDRVLVTNTTSAPFRYICNLEENGQSVCTGTLIGPSTVLTAQHCITGSLPASFRIIPGRNGASEPLPATRATAFKPFPGFVSAVTPQDIALIYLKDPIGNRGD